MHCENMKCNFIRYKPLTPFRIYKSNPVSEVCDQHRWHYHENEMYHHIDRSNDWE
jgi:hypothetical protein